MARYVYSDAYQVDIGAHVFPTAKYRLVKRRLEEEDGVSEEAFVEPSPAAEEDVVRVHERGYFERCRDNRLSPLEILQLELPWSPELFEAAMICVHGSVLAVRMALEHGVGLHIGGGFHHAFADHGEGFCVFNDPACAVRHAQAHGAVERALVVDCDLHHGNGTAAIFAADESVATFSIHQEHLYPAVKPPSTVDVGLPVGADDKRYLGELEHQLPPLFERQRPELVLYVSGADPFEEDQLGNLAVSRDGLRRRDELVAALCEEYGAPLAVVLAGGYARRVADTVDIHLTTLRTCRRLWHDD